MRNHCWTGLATVGLAALCCATPQAPTGETSAEPPPDPVVLTKEGERYLKDAYEAECASEYLFYPDGEGPPVPARTDAEWKEREQDLTTCLREKVAGRYTAQKTVNAVMWNGTDFVMSEGARKGIVQYGDAFLEDYVKRLLDEERGRAEPSEEPAGPRGG